MHASSILLTLGALAAGIAAAPLEARDNALWAGSNIYMLQALPEDVQESYLSELASLGTKVIRVWVNQQGPGCQKGLTLESSAPDYETEIGSYNTETLDLLDATLTRIASHGMKALISPHDANLVEGANGNDIYGKTYGKGDFYTSKEAKQAYDNRLKSIFDYTGATSGQRWGNWSAGIAAFDIQNEPFNSNPSLCQANDESDWLCGRAGNMRPNLDSAIKISTGGIGGDLSHNCNFMKRAVACDAVDLIAVHGYKGAQSSNPGQWSGAIPGWLDTAGDKLVYVEEFGTAVGDDNPDGQQSDFQGQADDITSGGIPWVYWQILPPQTCDTVGDDKYGIWQNGIDYQSSFKKAASATAKQSWAGIV